VLEVGGLIKRGEEDEGVGLERVHSSLAYGTVSDIPSNRSAVLLCLDTAMDRTDQSEYRKNEKSMAGNGRRYVPVGWKRSFKKYCM
jgi:hypothetical protein